MTQRVGRGRGPWYIATMRDALDDDEALPRVRTPLWPLFLIVALLAAGGAWVGWRWHRATDPLTVLVAIDVDGQWFEGSQAAAWLADALNAQLEELGFTPVRPGNPEVLDALEGIDDLGEAARAVGAGFVVGGAVALDVIEHPVQGGYVEIRATGTAEVRHVDDDEAAEGAPVRGWVGARERERALQRLMTRSMQRQIASEVLPRLLGHPVLAERLEQDLSTMGALADASRFVERRRLLLADADEKYRAAIARRQAAEKGPAPVTYHGDAADDDGLCGAGPRGICVRTDRVDTILTPGARRLGQQRALETVEWRRDGEVEVRWTGYNIYDYPKVSLDGDYVGFSEDVYGWAKAPVLIGPTGEATRLRVDPEKRFTSVEPAPGGASVACWVREGRDAPPGLVVLDANGDWRYEIEPAGGRFDDFAWRLPEQLLVLYTPPAEGEEPAPKGYAAERQTLWRQPAFGGDPTALYTVEEGESLSWMRVSRGGGRAIFARRHPEAPGLLVLDLESGEARPIPLAGRTSAPAFDATGERVVFNIEPPGRGGDEEVAIIELAADDPAATLRVLTDNPWRDRYPQFDPSGERVWFEQLGRDPVHERRGTSLIASVPIAPGDR